MMRAVRLAAVQIAIAAMLLGALLPAGWMPNPTGLGDSPFVICTMNGPVHLAPGTDAPHKQQPDGDNGANHQTCPFAAAPHFATPALTAMPAPPVMAANVPGLYEKRQRGIRVAMFAPQAPRAPPAFS